MDEDKRAWKDAGLAIPPWSLRISNIVGYIALICVNGLVQSGLLGPGNSEISKKFNTPLTPAGYALAWRHGSSLHALPWMTTADFCWAEA